MLALRTDPLRSRRVMAMAEAHFRFHDALTDFLAPGRQRVAFSHVFNRRASIKDMVEALGGPHPEIGRLVVNGKPVDFGYIVRDGDCIDAHPIAHGGVVPDGQTDQRVRFALDANLGALARDRDVLKRRIVTQGYFVRAEDPRAQLGEVVRRFDLRDAVRPFTRCSRCNGVLEDIDKAAIAHRLKPLTKRYYDTFRRCTGCDRIYWRGTHVRGIEALISGVHEHGDTGGATREDA